MAKSKTKISNSKNHQDINNNHINAIKKSVHDEPKIDNNHMVKSKHLINIENGRFDNPVHAPRASLFSSASGYTNYRGLLNLCVILLIMSMSRLVLENIIKYGLLVSFNFSYFLTVQWPTIVGILCCNFFIIGVLLNEKLIAANMIGKNIGLWVGLVIAFLTMTIPAIYVWYLVSNPLTSFFILSMYLITSLKLFSYVHVNKMCRDNLELAIKSNLITSDHVKNDLVKYPDNLNIKDIFYFLFAPTLCYELNFPRTNRIHVRYLLRRIAEIAFICTLEVILIQQWIIPIIQNSVIPFREASFSRMAERLLKLAVPNHVIWFIFFYGYFHTWLNIVAELMRFADREFYRDWWNAQTIDEFWRNWNIPVHRFCLRHIYKPLLSIGFSNFSSLVIVFLISAFFHEYLVSLPLKMFKIWAFLGMALNIPLALIIKCCLKGHYGNMAIWLSLIIGQPLAILMYIHDYFIDSRHQISH